MTGPLVTCRGCGEDFAADDGACPACGERRREQMGFPVGDLCARCGVQRLALNGTPLELGAPCEVCGALSVRVPRKPGEAVGDVVLGERGVDEQVVTGAGLGRQTPEAEGLIPAVPPGDAASRAPRSPSTPTTEGRAA